MPERDVAHRVLREAVGWSTRHPDSVREHMPSAALGLAGIRAYAEDVADVDSKPADYFKSEWLGCYAVNPQWTARNSTGVYLARLASSNTFRKDVNEHILAASREYKAAYRMWQDFDGQLGHGVPDDYRIAAWNDRERRAAGAQAVHEALEREKEAIIHLSNALRTVEKDGG
jgi:hypothetical protein